jgi:hypothetical protein
MLFEVMEDVVVVVHGQKAPDMTSWRALIEALEHTYQQFGAARLLVWTPGPAPDAVQRADVVRLANAQPLPIAVCTESRLARGAIQALSWASQIKIKPFKETDWAGACEHLGVPAHRASSLGQQVKRLQEQLEDSSGTFPTATRR